jgi:23S rRNA pseudouridine955/2504/2580 synthase
MRKFTIKLYILHTPDYMHLSDSQQKPPYESGNPQSDRATFFEVSDDDAGQRLDNFLIRVCKGVPKSHLYRIVRSGELRINKGRVNVQYRLVAGDVVRIPPIRLSASAHLDHSHAPKLELPVLFEDEGLLIVDKPAGIAVHGGSGVSFGVVERLRATILEPHISLELVHRLDRETSGVLVLAKKRRFLSALQKQVREKSWRKFYQCLVMGHWPDEIREVNAPLKKVSTEDGQRRVYINPDGAESLTRFQVLSRYSNGSLGASTLLQAQLMTGRTHQIRVHCASKGHCILGDDKYGQFAINKLWSKTSLNRMFLHAARLELTHPLTFERLIIQSPLPPALVSVLKGLSTNAI